MPSINGSCDVQQLMFNRATTNEFVSIQLQWDTAHRVTYATATIGEEQPLPARFTSMSSSSSAGRAPSWSSHSSPFRASGRNTISVGNSPSELNSGTLAAVKSRTAIALVASELDKDVRKGVIE